MNQSRLVNKFKLFFKDKNGKWAIIQLPNFLLSLFITLCVINYFTHDHRVASLQSASLFAWAYLELTRGASNFRKSLGAIFLIVSSLSFFV
ncbi:MAG: hypothetical protein ABIQ04_03670 [Candidatus Saccharimonadales bacterium]